MSPVTRDELANWRYQCEERIARSEMGKATPEWSLSVQDTLRLLNDVADLQRERLSLRAKVQKLRKKMRAVGDFKPQAVERGTRVRNEHVRTLKRGVRDLKAIRFIVEEFGVPVDEVREGVYGEEGIPILAGDDITVIVDGDVQ